MYAEPDPRHPLLRPAMLDPIRKPLALFLSGGAAVVGCYTLGERIFANTRGAADVASLDAGPSTPLESAIAALPTRGTVASGFYPPPPHGVIDPKRPQPIVISIG